MGNQRLFFGIQLSENVRAGLADAIQTLQGRPLPPSLRLAWTTAENLHVTLKFLGSTKPELVDQTISQARAAVKGIQPFEVSIRGLGGFPDLQSPKVLWVGAHDSSDLLSQLANKLDRALEPLGFKPEGRAFHPHVTLARVKEGAGLRKILNPLPNQEFGTCRVEEIILFESHTPGRGPVKYEPIARIGVS